MLRRRTKRELEAIVEGVPLREEIDPLPDYQTACGYLEDALKRAQEGKWDHALELRDKARELTQ